MENQTDVTVWSNVIPCCLSVSLMLRLTLQNGNASVCFYPAQVAGDPGEGSRVASLATSWRTKWHNANLSADSITLLVCKCTTTVTLQHKTRCHAGAWQLLSEVMAASSKAFCVWRLFYEVLFRNLEKILL
jgi:hypothetical protein